MLKRIRKVIAGLYPRAWRDRYGEEFAALLEDSPARWRDLPDMTKGALAMQLQQQSWKTVALLGVAGLIAAAGWMAFLRPPNFTSVARIRATDAKVLPLLSIHALSRTVLAELVHNFKLYESDWLKLPMEDIVEGMRRDIRVETDPNDAAVFTVQFRYPDAQKAQGVTRALVAQFMFENQVQSAKSILVGSTLEQVSPPDLFDPKRVFSGSIVLGAMALGVIAGLIVRQPFRRTLKLAGFTLAGLIVVATPFYLVNSRFISTATVVLKGDVKVPQGDVQVQEIPMPAGSPGRVYRMSAIRTDRFQAQRALVETLSKIPFESNEVIESPSLPYFPISPNRLVPALCGAIAALLYGLRRTRPSAVIAH